jgi:hypothetical protein
MASAVTGILDVWLSGQLTAAQGAAIGSDWRGPADGLPLRFHRCEACPRDFTGGACGDFMKKNDSEASDGADNVIPFPVFEASEDGRVLTEAEVRGGLFAAMEAIEYARRTVAHWIGRKPTSDEMLNLVSSLQQFEKAVTEQMVRGPETDGRALDAMAEFFRRQSDSLDPPTAD